MNELSKDLKEKPDYIHLFPEYTDEEIIKILKTRKYYQKEAADAAIKEAIERKLISSKQDLFAPEFNEFTLKRRWFPNIEKKENKIKIRRSIARVLLISGIFPLIWGFLNVNSGNMAEGFGLVSGGVLWMFFSAMLNREASKTFVKGLFVLLGIGVLYLGLLFSRIPEPAIMDLFITVVLVALSVYGLLFMYRLKK